MIVYNFFGGPGSGKSTTAAYIFAKLKNKGVKAELAREVAKDYIWEGRTIQLSRNQFLVSANQYSRLKDLEANGCEIAVCDSPMVMSLVYARGVSYYPELKALLYAVDSEFENINIFLTRSKPYSKFGRMQDEDDAKALDADIRALQLTFDYIVPGNQDGQDELFQILWRKYEQAQIVRSNLVG